MPVSLGNTPGRVLSLRTSTESQVSVWRWNPFSRMSLKLRVMLMKYIFSRRMEWDVPLSTMQEDGSSRDCVVGCIEGN
ncbi:unnamed protein product [Calypogeia fissa]